MKISSAPLKQIIKEILFYRVFHRESEEKKETLKKKEETR